MQFFLLCFIFILSTANFSWSESTVNCHCFQEREYNPQHAYAADPYFLATTQNAFLANLFGLSKKDLVRAKMAGADGDNLWVGYYLAGEGEKTLDEVNTILSTGGDWSSVVKQLKIDPEQLGPLFMAALHDPMKLATIVVDEQLVEVLDVEVLQLQKLREQGAGNKQTILSAFLGKLRIQKPVKLFSQVEAGQSSWGGLLAEQGLFNGSEIDDKWRQILKRKSEKE